MSTILEMERREGSTIKGHSNFPQQNESSPSPHQLTEEQKMLELNHKRSLMLGNVTISHYIELNEKWGESK